MEILESKLFDLIGREFHLTKVFGEFKPSTSEVRICKLFSSEVFETVCDISYIIRNGISLPVAAVVFHLIYC